MRYLLAFLLLPAFLFPALAQDAEAEKLYRDMEKRIKAAKAFQFTFTYQIDKRKANGSLLLTSDNKARLKISGNFGEKRNAVIELVADGKRLKTKGARFFVASNGQSGMELGGTSEWWTPTNFHAVLSATVSRGGMWFSVLMLPYLRDEAIDPDAEGSKMHAYDFKMSDAEKVGERDAKVIHYRFGKGGGCRDDEEMTLWIDAQTLLPLKRTFALKRDDVRITETYTEFKLDPKIDAKAFELPKVIVKTWEEAGVIVGSMGVNKHGALVFVGPEKKGPEEANPAGVVPAYQFTGEGLLAKLPSSPAPFGLDLSGTRVTDAGLKELAGLKSLQSLNLFRTRVTGAGLKELAGLESLQTLWLGDAQATSAGLKELAGLKGLQTLILSHTEVTDAGLKELARLKSLQSLSLGRTRVTDAGLKEVARLENLQALYLDDTEVTDAGVKELAGLKNLRTLFLSRCTMVTKAGLKELAGLKDLQALYLDSTQVTDAGLKALAGLKSLQTLSLGDSRVTDAGLKELAGLKSLQSLYLHSTQVTDAGLKELAGLKSLQSLYLHSTQVTDAGLKELRKALPRCTILR